MIALQIYKNGELAATAGYTKPGMLSASVNADIGKDGSEMNHGYLTVSGVFDENDSGTFKPLEWYGLEEDRLKIGDEITVRIVETGDVDEPRTPRPLSFVERMKINFIRLLG